MATMRLRKTPENSEKGLGWRAAGIISLLVGPIWFLFGLASHEPLHLAMGIVLTGVGIASMVVGWKILVAERGPYLLEIDPSKLTDLRIGETFPWKEITTLAHVRDSAGESLKLVDSQNKTHSIIISGFDQSAESISSAAVDHHRRAQGKGSLATELHQTGATILCPACGEESESVKSYQYLSMLFAFVAYGYQTSPQVGCPSCTRKMIGKNLLVNLATANVVWPVICLPWGIVLFLMSFSHGHSKSVLKTLAEEVVSSGHVSQ